jgi:ABC-2 type transport system ATP-binding protein
MKRRVLVAQALVHKPPVIVLDEPTAGVDVELRQALWAFIRRLNAEGHTIVLTTHYLEEAEALCNRIAMLQGGRIVAHDTTQNLLARFAGCAVTLRTASGELPAPFAARAQRRGDGAWRLDLDGYAELETVLAGLREAGLLVTEMEVAPPDLEEVFVRIMRHGDAVEAAA